MNNKLSFGIGFISGLALMAIAAFLYLSLLFSGLITFGIGGGDSNQPDANQQAEMEPVAEITLSGSDYILGNPDAPVKIVEYSDIECPFCARVHPTLDKIVKDYNGQVAWIYKHFPLDQIHPNATPAAMAVECAAELGGGNETYWAYLDNLIQNQGALGENLYRAAAENVGVSADALMECVQSGKYLSKVQEHSAEAYAAGGRGTPFMVILNDSAQVPVSGALPESAFREIIDPLL